ncbi:MAG: poly(A) polymerase, partial [Granulosicoccus sp.]
KTINEILEWPVVKVLAEASQELGRDSYIIGGFVRDIFLDRPSKDIDVVTIGSGIDLAKRVSKKMGNAPLSVFKNFGTAMVKTDTVELEFVGARKESYRRESRKPIVENGTLKDDQDRRDFSINAMAISLNKENFGEVLDPFDGLLDLENRIIRTPLDPDITYSDDPLRMMRAIRFATQLGFDIEPESFKSIERNKDRLKIVSQERITDELNKIIMAKKPSKGFRLMLYTGLLDIFFPEMGKLKGIEKRNGLAHKDNFYHTLEVLDNVAAVSDKLYLRWAAILHDISKPATKRFDEKIGWTFHGHDDKGARLVPKLFRRLKLPLDNKMKFVQKLVALHLRPIALTKSEISDSAVRRMLFDAGEDIDELMILCRADITSKNEAKVKRYLKNYDKVLERIVIVEEKDKLRNWEPPITGEMIMKTFDIGPSREVGQIKNAIREAILDGEIPNTEEDARRFMMALAEKMGLIKV